MVSNLPLLVSNVKNLETGYNQMDMERIASLGPGLGLQPSMKKPTPHEFGREDSVVEVERRRKLM